MLNDGDCLLLFHWALLLTVGWQLILPLVKIEIEVDHHGPIRFVLDVPPTGSIAEPDVGNDVSDVVDSDGVVGHCRPPCWFMRCGTSTSVIIIVSSLTTIVKFFMTLSY